MRGGDIYPPPGPFWLRARPHLLRGILALALMSTGAVATAVWDRRDIYSLSYEEAIEILADPTSSPELLENALGRIYSLSEYAGSTMHAFEAQRAGEGIATRSAQYRQYVLNRWRDH